MRYTRCSFLAMISLMPTAGLAQTSIDPSSKFSWCENVGFMNWADAGDPLGSQSVLIQPSYLTGFIWCENTGWLKLGAGIPADGASYANSDGSDWGVNHNSNTGNLSGLAWGENIGWVNFSGGALANPTNPARLDTSANRLRGYAWSENVGWINLDDSTVFVGTLPPACPADFNRDGFVTGEDFDGYVAAFEAGTTDADFNGDGFVNADDFDAFVDAFEAGC